MNPNKLLLTIVDKKNPLLSNVVCQKIDSTNYLCGGNKYLFAFFKTDEITPTSEVKEFTCFFRSLDFSNTKYFVAKDVKEEINEILSVIKDYNKLKPLKQILRDNIDSETFRDNITSRKTINCPKLFYIIHQGKGRLAVKLDTLEGCYLPLPAVKFIYKAFEDEEQICVSEREIDTCFFSKKKDKIIDSANFIFEDFIPINQ